MNSELESIERKLKLIVFILIITYFLERLLWIDTILFVYSSRFKNKNQKYNKINLYR